MAWRDGNSSISYNLLITLASWFGSASDALREDLDTCISRLFDEDFFVIGDGLGYICLWYHHRSESSFGRYIWKARVSFGRPLE